MLSTFYAGGVFYMTFKILIEFEDNIKCFEIVTRICRIEKFLQANDVCIFWLDNVKNFIPSLFVIRPIVEVEISNIQT